MESSSFKNHVNEYKIFRNRCLIGIAGVMLLMLILVMRLVYLQLIQNNFYSTLSQQNLLAIIPTEPNRGLIYDRNGVLLARNIAVYNLDVIPGKVMRIDKVIEALQSIIKITPDDVQEFKRALKQHRRFDPIPLKVKLSERDIATFYVNQYRFPGIMIQTHLLREYPMGATMGSVVGYVGRINTHELNQLDHDNYSASDYIGKLGIEKQYEAALHGQVGAEEVEIDASGHVVRVLRKIKPIAGDDLYLTVDSRLQSFAEKELADNPGAIVAIQPKTGQVLAMVTEPNYDPNLFVEGINNTLYQELLHAERRPLYNRAIRGLYSPGSTVKPFSALTGLDSQIITTADKVFDPGWFKLPNSSHVYHDWRDNGHGWVNVTRAITVSCDIFFYTLANKLGISRLDSVFKAFGYGEKTGIDLPNEISGLVPTPEWKHQYNGQGWYPGDTIITGIGQGSLLVTPLQLAVAAAALSEHGKRMTPHLILKSNGKNISVPVVRTTLIKLHNPKNWGIVIEAMEGVIDSPEGTAHSFGPHSGYLVAAKTGTAQVYGKQRDEEHAHINIPWKLRNNHLFIAFAPVENPQIAIAIVVEHGARADRMAGDIIRYYLNNLLTEDGEALAVPRPTTSPVATTPIASPAPSEEPHHV